METTARKMVSASTTKSSAVTESVSIAELPTLTNVWVDDTRVHFDLDDARSISWPISWLPRLIEATPEQRQHFTYSAYHVFWDELDEIMGVKNVLYPPAKLPVA